ncbi:relaxase MobL [Virgibacillus dokdonensis]|nr:relaxase MobL [Virgibacillus dokdonensis]
MSSGIVLVSKFVMADSKEYQDYINYIDRDEAK